MFIYGKYFKYVANALYAFYEYNYNLYYDCIKSKFAYVELFPRRLFGKLIVQVDEELACTSE